MPVISGIIGGNSARNAGRTIGGAGTAASTAIGTAGNEAAGATNAATTAGQGLYNTAVTGVGNATSAGQGYVNNAYGNTQNIIGNANNVAGNLLGGQLQNLSPYLQTGATGTNSLNSLVQQGFQAPTAAQAAATPGEQFQLQQGLQGVEQQLGSSGGAATGGALKALTQYGQNVASTYYQNAFNNSLNAYNTNVNTAATAAGQGLNASGMANQAAQNFGNTYNNNSQYLAGQGMNAAQYNAGLGLSGASTAGNLLGQDANFGLQGATTAGNQNMLGTEEAGQFFLQGAEGTAAGQLGQGQGYASAINGASNLALGALGGFGGLFGGGSSPIGSPIAGYQPMAPNQAPGSSYGGIIPGNQYAGFGQATMAANQPTGTGGLTGAQSWNGSGFNPYG